MNTLEIRGIISGSPFMEMFGETVTVESRFRAALAKMSGPLELYISSFGGEVTAGNEMINALKAYAATPGNEITVTLGAICASQASVIAVNFPSVKAHANTVIMFHSCHTFACGGPTEMEQAAKLLRIFNQSAIDALTAKGIAGETATAWISGPGETWLSAAEAKSLGIISEIIGENAPPQTLPDEKLVTSLFPGEANAPRRAAACAALKPFSRRTDAVVAVTQTPNGEPAMPTPNKPKAQTDPVTPPVTDPAAEPQTEDVETLKAKVTELEGQLAEKDEKIAELEAALTAAAGEKEKIEARAVKAETSLNQLTGKTLKPGSGASAAQGGDPVATWKEKLASVNGNYVVARKKFPEDYNAYMKAAVPK